MTDDLDWDTLEAQWQEILAEIPDIPVCSCSRARHYTKDIEKSEEYGSDIWVHVDCGNPTAPWRKNCYRCERQYLSSAEHDECKTCRESTTADD